MGIKFKSCFHTFTIILKTDHSVLWRDQKPYEELRFSPFSFSYVEGFNGPWEHHQDFPRGCGQERGESGKHVLPTLLATLQAQVAFGGGPGVLMADSVNECGLVLWVGPLVHSLAFGQNIGMGKTPNYLKKTLLFSLWVKILAQLHSVWPGKAPWLLPAAGK